jgi:release factor glutamine methyltransferase
MKRNLNHCKFACMNIEEANRMLLATVSEMYDEREAASICSLVMEHLTGMPKSVRVLHKIDALTVKQTELLQIYQDDLKKYRPVQYVLGEAWFGSLPFYVNEHVLIPRPETEELVEWLISDSVSRKSGETILDIGTGSGCIPVYIKKKRNDFRILAMDISESALEIAKKNSLVHDTVIEFLLCDFLNPLQWESVPPIDLIISNPPYIPENQKQFMDKHVKDFEPGMALFVPDHDPLIFYRNIGVFANQKLKPGGAIFLEIHHDYAREIMNWYELNGFKLELKKDYSGNNRMIKACRS